MLARMWTPGTVVILVASFGHGPLPAASKGFLEDHSAIDGKAFWNDVRDAMGAMKDCGGEFVADKLSAIEKSLLPMWRTMPKNSYGRIARRSLRYVAHRHFMQQSSLMIRGFEPFRLVNKSYWGVADILNQQVPGYVEAVLESRQGQHHGFSLNDTVNMIAMLDYLIFDSQRVALEKAYKLQDMGVQHSLSHDDLTQVLEAYLGYWMLGDDDGIESVLRNRSFLVENVPHWEAIVAFAEGRIKTLEFARQRAPQPRRGKDTWEQRYSFDDAHEVVGSITTSFQSFWESECVSMKMDLVAMDRHNTGRVPLSKVYAFAMDVDWRFGESEAYLRELGALDETSRWNSKQVIIPNYLQAASNCIISTPHYRVCCVSECEAHFGEIEDEIAAPEAEVGEILAVVGNMTVQSTLDDDSSPDLEGSLAAQLQQVAESHGGKVPLHGRLFAQWLHYVFPRECPFPHKIGSIDSLAPTEFGGDYMANSEDMKALARKASARVPLLAAGKEELHWMSQWSEDEEFFADYSQEFGNPFGFHPGLLALGGLALAGGAAGFGRMFASSKTTSASPHKYCV